MRLKKWLIFTYFIVMIIPIITGVFIYKSIGIHNKNVEVNEYIKTINRIQKYEKELENTELYIRGKRDVSLIKEEDKNSLKIDLYDKYGRKLYSSTKEYLITSLSPEMLYKNLYTIQEGYRANTIKRPVLLEGEVIGFYEIVVSKDSLVKSINDTSTIGLVCYVVVLFVAFITVIYMLNKKLTAPISILVDAMKAYARGEENFNITYKGKDEIGDLIHHFQSMKDEITKNKIEIKKQQKNKEYLIAAISHDLKTPLTSIRAYAEALREYKNLDSENISNYTSIILNKSDYMKNMLEDLLTYTLLSTEYKLDFVKVDSEEFLEMLFSGYDELCEGNEINIIKEINVSGSCRIDVKAMIRVMDNLVSNALRYVEKSGSICLGAYSEESKLPLWLGEDFIKELEELRKGKILICVKNEGKAIPKEKQDKIFNAFYQGDESRSKTSKSGTGLGLSIVKIIIEKHEGYVKILSKENLGTAMCCLIENEKEG